MFSKYKKEAFGPLFLLPFIFLKPAIQLRVKQYVEIKTTSANGGLDNQAYYFELKSAL